MQCMLEASKFRIAHCYIEDAFEDLESECPTEETPSLTAYLNKFSICLAMNLHTVLMRKRPLLPSQEHGADISSNES